MPYLFLPDVVTESLTDLTPEMLASMHIKLLMLDFDNTIVPYTTSVPTEAMAGWLEQMKASDITLCVVSNSRNHRVPDFCAKYGIDCITRAKKPSRRGVLQCLARFGVSAHEAALVGDQIYTDTLCANRSGVRAILVKAIDNHNFWLKARHIAEKPFIYFAKKRSIHYEEH